VAGLALACLGVLGWRRVAGWRRRRAPSQAVRGCAAPAQSFSPCPSSPPTPTRPRWGPLLPFNQWPEYDRLSKSQAAIVKLLNSVDVLGVSCYARTSANPQPAELESCAVKYDNELKAMGFDLKKWSDAPGKRFM
jgi:hypothetical protein